MLLAFYLSIFFSRFKNNFFLKLFPCNSKLTHQIKDPICATQGRREGSYAHLPLRVLVIPPPNLGCVRGRRDWLSWGWDSVCVWQASSEHWGLCPGWTHGGRPPPHSAPHKLEQSQATSARLPQAPPSGLWLHTLASCCFLFPWTEVRIPFPAGETVRPNTTVSVQRSVITYSGLGWRGTHTCHPSS